MIYSMTGFAAASAELPGGSLNLDLRSVNHRYLEVQFRLNDEFRTLEPAMREAIGKQLTRGKVDCRLGYTPIADGQRPLHLNTVLVQQLVQLDAAVRDYSPGSVALSVSDILRWPGVIAAEEASAERLHETCLGLLQTALDDLSASRQREGEKLKQMILDRVAQMEVLANQAKPRIPGLVATFQERLATRLKEAGVNCDDDRIRQELALFAQKIDVDEELSRLQAHLSEVKRVLQASGAAGKRLDFLMQELNREANTLGSKSVDAEISQVSMEMKVLVEQMREQIQNIE